MNVIRYISIQSEIGTAKVIAKIVHFISNINKVGLAVQTLVNVSDNFISFFEMKTFSGCL